MVIASSLGFVLAARQAPPSRANTHWHGARPARDLPCMTELHAGKDEVGSFLRDHDCRRSMSKSAAFGLAQLAIEARALNRLASHSPLYT